MKKLSFQVRQKLIDLSGACFWYWNNFFNFLESCGVKKVIINKYPKESFSKYQIMQNILNDLEEQNDVVVIHQIISEFFKMQNAVDKDYLDEAKAKRLLNEFKGLVGNDPIEREIEKKKTKEAQERFKKESEEKRAEKEKLVSLKNKFLELFRDESNPQQRGFDFESLFFEILELEKFDFSKPYKIQSEQIDGHFKYEKFDYLIELKWQKKVCNHGDLDQFDGKIKRKAQSTRGFFLAVNGFDPNTISAFSVHSPRIILMDGQDLMLVFDGRISFYDCLKTKVNALVKHGNIFCKNL